uniref:Bm15491 n=1 Tax=Brugia malayi TaxID=6279 RepID=A0A0H5S3C3_BRUMA|nr:Bm15491 [Brugia malayi]
MLRLQLFLLLRDRAFFTTRRWSVNDFTLRTHTCGELRVGHENQKVTLYGWLQFNRLNRFLVLRDAYGCVQARIPEKRKDLIEKIKMINCESVLKIEGVVADRGEQYRNANMRTGDIEVLVDDLELLNTSPANYPLNEVTSTEETKLRYRFLDLRTERMQRALRLRANVVHGIRKYLVEKANFTEVETPTLFRRTPGGSHEFIVPAPKPNLRKFYSLPQSPQQFKQLLMCGGIDRYFQIARCYRDEGAKSDRQPEFTQVDIELSFTDQDNVMKLIENIIVESWPKELDDLKPSAPFKRMKYLKAERLFGTDKPDLRIPWTIEDCTSELSFLRKREIPNFVVKIFIARNADDVVNEKNLDEWSRILQDNMLSKVCNAINFKFLKMSEKNWFVEIRNNILIEKFGINEKDSALRHLVGEAMHLRAEQRMEFVWITHFPLFSRNAEGRLESAHHPFTAPIPDDVPLLYEPNKLLSITGQHYDLVLNGVELGGGSIRIHNADVQRHVLSTIYGESLEEMEHMIKALSYGAPPHGGFAIGLDRYVALLFGRGDSSVPIRDVIAFPKSKEGNDLMTKCPVEATPSQLSRYGISVPVTNEVGGDGIIEDDKIQSPTH